MLKRISGYFKPYISSLVSALICSLLVGGVTAATAKLVEPILDDVFINRDERMLEVIPIVVVVLFLIKGVARYAQQVILVRVGETVVIKIRNDLMSAIQYREMRFFEENATGSLLARMLTDVSAMQGAIPSVVDFVRHLFAAIGLITVLFMQDWKLAFIALFVMPLAIYPVKRVSHLIKNYTKRVQTRLGLLSKILVEAFSGIEVVKSFGTEEREIGRFLDESDNVLRQILKRARVNAATSPFLELLGAVGAALIIGYGGHQVLKGTMTPGNFFSFLTALLLLSEPVKKLGSVNNRIQQAIGAAERVFGIMDEERALMETAGQLPLEGDVAEVSFDDVHFSYAKGEEVL
ncbi:MAG: hypothetical protein C0609_10035 [Deltaproteobacteria bacterium]|nr:MAG: hypothetical protein C0609_10035 [Deltaproteobacteria bacterium]